MKCSQSNKEALFFSNFLNKNKNINKYKLKNKFLNGNNFNLRLSLRFLFATYPFLYFT